MLTCPVCHQCSSAESHFIISVNGKALARLCTACYALAMLWAAEKSLPPPFNEEIVDTRAGVSASGTVREWKIGERVLVPCVVAQTVSNGRVVVQVEGEEQFRFFARPETLLPNRHKEG